MFCAASLLCFVALVAASPARADEVTIKGTTSGSSTNLGGTTTGASLLGLQYVNSGFDATTVNGTKSLNGAAANPAGTNTNNLGSFYLEPPARPYARQLQRQHLHARHQF